MSVRDLDSILRGTRGVRSAALGRPLVSPFSAYLEQQKSRTRAKSVPELIQRENELRSLQREFGVRDIEEDRPGVFRIIIDLLSRPNYAIAGALEELMSERSVEGAVFRAFRELFSGVGDVTGEKRAFGEVLERMGVGTKTLADAFPLLEGTIAGKLGSRGALGLALDITTDPLTYITFGASRVLRFFHRSAGDFALSQKGFQKWVTIQRETAEDAGGLARLTSLAPEEDAAAALRKVGEKAQDRMYEAIRADGALLDPGGVKFMGRTLWTPQLKKRLSPKVRQVIEALPRGKEFIEHALKTKESISAMGSVLFNPFDRIRSLPPGMRSAARALHSQYVNSSVFLERRMAQRIDDSPIAALLHKDKDAWARIRDAREGEFPIDKLSREEQQALQWMSDFYDEMHQKAVGEGILEPEQFWDFYLNHEYKNPPEEILQVFLATNGTTRSTRIGGRYNKGRVFATHQEALRKSRLLNQESVLQRKAGGNAPIYPVLEPETDGMKVLHRYGQWYAKTSAMKAFVEDVKRNFGKTLDYVKPREVYRLSSKPYTDDLVELEKIKDWFGRRRTIGRIDFEYIEDTAKLPKRDIPQLFAGEKAEVGKFIKSLSEAGRKDFFRELFLRVRSGSSFAHVVEKFSEFQKYMPAPVKELEGTAEVALEHFGEKAIYRPVVGKFWGVGNRPIQLPVALVDDVENVNARILNTKDFQKFGKLLSGYDWLNNWFKFGVYTFWPGSATRDIYSNVAFSMADIAFHAVNPQLYVHSVGVIAGKEGFLETATGAMSYKFLKEEAKKRGVWASGRTFIEETGGRKAFTGKFKEGALEVRGMADNITRIALFVQNLRRGLSLDTAAEKVAETLFSYNLLADIEKSLFRRLVPFYTFTRKNIEFQVKLLRSKPGLALNQLKPFRGRESENEWMAKWEGEALKIRLDRDGNSVHMLTGLDLPLRNVDQFWRGTLSKTVQGLLGTVSPILRTPIEVLAAGRSFFTGDNLHRTRSDTVGLLIDKLDPPDRLKDWLGYKKSTDFMGRTAYTFDGERFTLLFRSWVLSRALSTSDRQFREFAGDNSTWWRGLVDFMTLMRVKTGDHAVNMTQQQRQKLITRIRQLEEALRDRGVFQEFAVRFEGDRPQEFR